MSSTNKIRRLEQRRQALMERLLDTQSMIRGSFGSVHRKCGRANCWCSEGGGHPVNRINFSDEGRSRTKAIQTEDVDWAKSTTGNYKRFRKNRQALRALEEKINQAIDEFEVRIIAKTARQRKYKT